MQALLLLRSLRRIVDKPVDAVAGVAALLHLVQHHGMGDLHMRHQCFRSRVDKLVERVLVPRYETFRSLFALDLLQFLRIVACLGQSLGVLDFEFGGFGYDQTLRVEAHASGASCDLMELAGAQLAHLRAVELGQRGQYHGMNRHIDTDTKRVGAADHWQQSLLGELLHQTTIAGEHAGMVDADAGPQQTLQDLAERGGELRALDGFRDRGALLLAGHARAGQRVGGLQRGILREMHHVNRRLALAERQFHRLLQRVECVFVRQRHGTWRIGDDIHVGVRHVLKLVGDCVDIAQRRAHQQELRIRQRKQRHLPSPAALGIAVIVELVHRHAADIGVAALAQRLIGEDLRGAADDRRIRVDMRVAGDHADVLAAENFNQVEELLRHQSLDRSRVIGTAARAQRGEMHAERHQRLARTGRSVQNDMVAGQQIHDGLLLMRPRFHAFDVLHPGEETLIDLIRVDVALALVPIRRQRAQRAIIRIVCHACQSTGWGERMHRTCVRIVGCVAVQWKA